MGGAYTSKPEIPPSNPAPPEIPIGWNPDWPFPGANPPGYNPYEGSLIAHSVAEIDPGDSVASSGRWEDGSGGPVGLPAGAWTQTWTAEIDGTPIGIREYGSGSFQSSLEYNFGTIGTSWYGVADDIEFNITDDDRGSTITLTISSELGDDTYDISVKTISTNYLKLAFSRVDVYGAEGVLTVSCSGGSCVFSSESNSVTSATGVMVQTGAKEVTIDAEDLTSISPDTISGHYEATSTISLQTKPQSTCSVQLYDEAYIPVTGESASKQFSLILGAYESNSMDANICTVSEDEVTQL